MSTSRRAAAAAVMCVAAVGTAITTPSATASPLDDVIDALDFGSSGAPTTTSPALRPFTVRFPVGFGAGSTVTFYKTSSFCVGLPMDPVDVSTAGVNTTVTLAVDEVRTRQCSGLSGDAAYTLLISTPSGLRYGGIRVKVNYGNTPATFVACTDVVHFEGGSPVTCARESSQYATVLVLP